jgi:hypothetical protein
MYSSIFFKHKYLTMPSLTPADTLIRAADDIITALAGVIPPPSMTTDAIAQLINIFKTQAKKEKDKATLRRVLQENTQAERVLNETMALPTSPTNKPVDGPTSPQTNTKTTYPPLEIDRNGRRHTTRNTDYQSRRQPQLITVQTITHDYLFHLMDTSFLHSNNCSPTNKPAHGNIHCNSSVTSPTRSSTTKQETCLNTDTYSSIRSTRTYGANVLERRSNS